jgi:hypothetical protein
MYQQVRRMQAKQKERARQKTATNVYRALCGNLVISAGKSCCFRSSLCAVTRKVSHLSHLLQRSWELGPHRAAAECGPNSFTPWLIVAIRRYC